MKFFKNPFVRFLTSGFGTGTDAGKAMGIAILICLIPIVLLIYAVSFFLDYRKKKRARQSKESNQS
jgi:hypothetical protein